MSLSLLRKDPVHELELNRALLAGNQRRLAAVHRDSIEAIRLEILCAALAKEVRWWQRQAERELLTESPSLLKGDRS